MARRFRSAIFSNFREIEKEMEMERKRKRRLGPETDLVKE